MSELDYTRYCDQHCNDKWLENNCFECLNKNSINKRKCLKIRKCEKNFEECVAECENQCKKGNCNIYQLPN